MKYEPRPLGILFLSLILLITVSGCSTTSTAPQSRIPPTKSSAPRFTTSERLKKEIEILESQRIEDPENQEILLRLASLYVEVKNDSLALERMLTLKNLGFEKDPRMYGSMASIYKRSKKYDLAIEHFLIFKELFPVESPTVEKINAELEQLNFIVTALKNSEEFELRPFGKSINTRNLEYLPQFTMDDSTIIFTRRFFEQEDLFVARLGLNGYSVEPLEEINTLGNEGAHSLSADGQLLIFTKCLEKRGFGSCDLYRSRLMPNGKWSTPSNMGSTINTRVWEAQPSLSTDGSTLYFSSKRTGGLGGSDIWWTEKQEDGTWGIPRNLKEINTKFDESSPFIHADGKTLYFRSKGHLGMGDFDLYMTRKERQGWSTPVNLGSPLNTTGEDGALVVSLDGTRGYYATDTYENRNIGHLDIFEFDLPESLRPDPMTFLTGRIIDGESNMPIQGRIDVEGLGDSEYAMSYTADINGQFLAAIPISEPVLININAENYLFHSEHVAFDEVKYSIDPYSMKITLEKISIEETSTPRSPVVLKNIFFESGSARLLPISNNEIEKIFALLQSEPKVRIKITGHTDDVGSIEDNLELSKLRADAVVNALFIRGIDSNRVVAEGKGESEPIDTNATEEGRANNRRTELEIID